jgi:hypothetical protein
LLGACLAATRNCPSSMTLYCPGTCYGPPILPHTHCHRRRRRRRHTARRGSARNRGPRAIRSDQGPASARRRAATRGSRFRRGPRGWSCRRDCGVRCRSLSRMRQRRGVGVASGLTRGVYQYYHCAVNALSFGDHLRSGRRRPRGAGAGASPPAARWRRCVPMRDIECPRWRQPGGGRGAARR